MTLFVGIDPGAQGGIATLSPDGVVFRACPKTEAGVPQLLRAVLDGRDPKEVKVVMEKVGGYIGGSAGNIGSAMFVFGRGVGVWVGSLLALGMTFQEVAPRTWQAGLGIVGRLQRESKAEWKGRLRQEAQQRYPRLKVTLATSDALLLATWCKHTHEGG